MAGAGIADHLHQHAVPRWGGDTDFMPVVGLTRVLPQVLSETRDLLAAAWPTDVVGRPECSARVSRPAVAKVVAPVVARLGRAGVTPDMVTVTGTVGAVAAGAVVLIGTGHLFWGASPSPCSCCSTCSTARWPGPAAVAQVFGAVLDSVGDRAADAAIFGALVWWCSGAGDDRLLVLLALICLVLGILTSYIKARAEGAGLSCDVGIVERTKRLILVLAGTGFTGLGIPYAVHVALVVLLAGSAVTVVQRIVVVHRTAPRPADRAARRAATRRMTRRRSRRAGLRSRTTAW